MGTFTITGASTVASKVGVWSFGTSGEPGYSTANADLVAAINGADYLCYDATVNGTGTGTIQFAWDVSANIISLDGGAATNYNSLPSGFTILSAALTVRVSGGTVTGFPNGDALAYLRFTPTEESAAFDMGNFINADFTYDYVTVPSTPTLFSTGFGLKATVNQAVAIVVFISASVSGTYSLTPSIWYYNPETNLYSYLASNPGTPWIDASASPPTPSITSVTPSSGT